MPQIQDINPYLPVIMPPNAKVPSIRDIGKKPAKDDDVTPKNPPCPNCGTYHHPFHP
jgi:hypothetical protein